MGDREILARLLEIRLYISFFTHQKLRSSGREESSVGYQQVRRHVVGAWKLRERPESRRDNRVTFWEETNNRRWFRSYV